MKKELIQQWEDGLRTSGKFGEYEWWYFDAKLDGGYSLVIIFYSQPVTAGTLGFAPCVSLSLTGNGYELLEEVSFEIKDCHFSKDGYEHFPIFVIYKNGEKLGCDIDSITYRQENKTFDPITKKHYHKTLIYDYNDGKYHFRITYSAEDIIETFVVDQGYGSARAKASKALIWFVKKMKLAPSYIRMVGTITFERFEGENVVETLSENGIWEQMYFGLDADV